ncbi:non-hydrolyzing UDP-N-acetylglucosamine 2-epimerase [Actinophytocola algeriensis]|uniref:UDP-N-acetylglucosamine 2-epimerase (Non-hydrolyzing) n=1 Tax=Actinophytocola algeriensis TaxID=1768010 RepID=A0A7W7VDG3_9PSEU|nr:UDP-N-acetylglucosamine 2-epimerase (non-hydrolyzing) [Actinophytocola algeriensis]MBB4905955.1 UDP-N-acetylglucosamine 2-epimerase (non-hydrolyzing) [Actinophytocola algeriensis]MBE1472360.1 UDP-N-acetylglucosamine 2-epimerase (non-hydrolyzing) [Actinophytocola algeriensis]
MLYVGIRMGVRVLLPSGRIAPELNLTGSADAPGRDDEDTVTLVCGTRPELIKLAPLIRLFGRRAAVVYTGQHYDSSMYSLIRRDIAEPGRFHELAVGGASRGRQLGQSVAAVDEILTNHPTSAVFVQGDTTSALAGALAANAAEVPLVHVEAGLRSYDRAMPEEHNRVLIDHLADLCCAPTGLNRDNLLAEGVAAERIAVTGNTVVEALRSAVPSAAEQCDALSALGLVPDGYIVATIHRPENVDEPGRLASILRELARLPLPVVLPLHPRTGKRIEQFGMVSLLDGLRVVEPQAYPAFLGLVCGAAVVVSDSGGIQEEVSVLKRPVVVVRRSTERPEIEGTFGTLVPPGPRIHSEVLRWLDDVAGNRARLAGIPSPYGEGSPSARIADAVRRLTAAPSMVAAT